jgi:hypothetical protein
MDSTISRPTVSSSIIFHIIRIYQKKIDFNIVKKYHCFFPNDFVIFYACEQSSKDDEFRFESKFFGCIKNTKEMLILS